MTSKFLSKHVYYDEIPEAIFQRTESILDVGAADGWNQTVSIHKDHFLKKQYVGIDPMEQEDSFLPIIKADALEWDTDKTFDLVLAIHVIEHVPLAQWSIFTHRLKKWTRPGGYLVIGCPYNEIYDGTNHSVPYSPHMVFEIQPEILESYFPGLKTVLLGQRGKFLHYHKDEAPFWVLARWLRRLLVGHYLAYDWIPRATRILAVWKKEGSTT